MPDILIADDHPLFRDALERAVRAAVPDATVHAADTAQALLALVDARPDADLLLLDLDMPGACGYSALVNIRSQYPGLPTIVVSGHDDASIARRALAHGAAAYLSKSIPAGQMIEAVRCILDGEDWSPSMLLRSGAELPPGETDAATRVASLTPQQFRVMTLLAGGKLNKQIAYELQVSEATVKAHMTAIMHKLGVTNRTQVALIAQELAL